MAQEYRIVSRFNEDVEYTFDDMLLDEEDEMTESDVHHIEIFGKPYAIAMGKKKNSEEDETLGFFICYLLYEKNVIRKLGIYEINISANEMESLNHRTFNFEKEKLILFDEYYEDTEKLQPFMYKKEDNVPTKTIIRLKQGIAEFEEDVEQQKILLQQLQERVEKNKPEKTPDILDKYNRYISFLLSSLNEKREREIVKKNIRTNFKSIEVDKITTFVPEESILHENLMKSDVLFDVYNLIMFELMAKIKIIIIENDNFDFHFLKLKETAKYEKIDKLSIYKKFDPTDVMFIHKSTNEDEETSLNLLQYNGKLFNSFRELGNDKFLKLIQDKLSEHIEEEQHPTRFAHLKNISVKVEENKPEIEEDPGAEEEEEREVEDLDAEEQSEQEDDTPTMPLVNLEDVRLEHSEQTNAGIEDPVEESKGQEMNEENQTKINFTPTNPAPKLKISE